MAIVGLMVSIAYPSLTSGLDGIRLRTSLDQAGAFFHLAQQQADRRQLPIQLSVDPRANRLTAISVGEGWQDRLDFTDGIHLVYPPGPVRYMLYPGSPPPQLTLLLATRQGVRKGLRINVFTGVPEIWDGAGVVDPSIR